MKIPDPIDFEVLSKEYDKVESIPYVKLLNTTEWFAHANKIKSRDNNRCSECGKGKTTSYDFHAVQGLSNIKTRKTELILLRVIRRRL
jgi:hypothetical protein